MRRCELEEIDADAFRHIRGPLTTREISKILGISHGTVQNIERRALEKMRQKLSEEWRP